MRRLFTVLAALVALLLTTAAPAAAQAQPAAPGAPADNPILFVHGYGMTGSTTWGTMINRFERDGHRSGLENWTYNTAANLTSTARGVGRQVDRILRNSSADKVDIICHSMGCLASRHYLKSMGGTAKVERWISLGGANKGTTMASTCTLVSAGCRDMVPTSSFVRSVNRGDQTPGPTAYWSLWSRGDGVIIPATNTLLDGAVNIELPRSVDHLSMLRDADVYRLVRDLVR
jgi:triacylglycerol lipase